MLPEERELLRRTVALSEENNDILRSIQRHMRFGRLVTTIYWIIIIGTAFGAFYFVQPYLKQVQGVYGNARSEYSTFSNFLNSVKQQTGK